MERRINASSSSPVQELDLVEEEDDPRLLLARRLPHRDEQVAEILTELATIGGALDRFHVTLPSPILRC